jgi:hypothetical protein
MSELIMSLLLLGYILVVSALSGFILVKLVIKYDLDDLPFYKFISITLLYVGIMATVLTWTISLI